MTFAIRPNEGVGPVGLGMSKQQVRQLFATAATTFRRNTFSRNDTDYFIADGIQVDYDHADRCDFITALEAAHATFQGREIVGMPFDQCRAWFEQLDDQLELDDTGFISRALGITVYLSGWDEEPMAPVECVSVFVEGYFEAPEHCDATGQRR